MKLVWANLAPYSSLGQSSPYDDEDGCNGDDDCADDGGDGDDDGGHHDDDGVNHDDDDYKACFAQLGPLLLSWPELS